MSTVYTPNPVKLGSLTLVSDGDGPGIKAADVNPEFEGLADGVAFGDQRTTPLADLAALAAITTPADGSVRHVEGQGFYVFRTAYTTGLSTIRVPAADATPGGWKSSTMHEASFNRMVPCSLINGISATVGGTLAQVDGSTATIVFVPLAPGDGQREGGSFVCNRTFTGATNYQAYYLPIDEFLVDGATLNTATLYFRPVAGHLGLPSRMPRWTICRVPITGYVPTIQNLSSLIFTPLSPTPGSAALYQADQSIPWINDIAFVVDRTAFRYFAIILDDAGTNAIVGNAYHAVRLEFTLADARRS